MFEIIFSESNGRCRESQLDLQIVQKHINDVNSINLTMYGRCSAVIYSRVILEI